MGETGETKLDEKYGCNGIRCKIRYKMRHKTQRINRTQKWMQILDTKEDVNMDEKFEASVGTIITAKHGANCGTKKVDVMIDSKKRSK